MRKDLSVIFTLTLIVRLYLVFFHPIEMGDNAYYSITAINIAEGHGFSQDVEPPYQPSILRTPLYSFLVSLCFRIFYTSYIPVCIIQSLAVALAYGIVYVIARRLFGRLVAFWSGIFSSLNPFTAIYSATLMMEAFLSLFLTFLVYAIFRLIQDPRIRNVLFCGICMALANFLRPILIYFPAFLWIGLLFIYNSKWKATCHVLIVSLIMFAAMVPWSMRNYKITGQYALTTPELGTQLWFGTSKRDIWTQDIGEVSEELLQDKTRRIMLNSSDPDEVAEANREALLLTWDYLKKNPYSYVLFTILNVPRIWIHVYSDQFLGFVDMLASSICVILLLLSIIGLWAVRDQWRQSLCLWILPVYVSITHAPLEAYARYTIPFRHFQSVFAVIGFLFILRKLNILDRVFKKDLDERQRIIP